MEILGFIIVFFGLLLCVFLYFATENLKDELYAQGFAEGFKTGFYEGKTEIIDLDAEDDGK